MKITADTNVLVRVLVGDDVRQSAIAESALSRAEAVAVTIPTLCEIAWVLLDRYEYSSSEVAKVVRSILQTQNIVVDRLVAEAGLAMLDRGGDFADGVIAYEGRRLGGEIFISFDKKAVKRLEAAGQSVRLLEYGRGPVTPPGFHLERDSPASREPA